MMTSDSKHSYMFMLAYLFLGIYLQDNICITLASLTINFTSYKITKKFESITVWYTVTVVLVKCDTP